MACGVTQFVVQINEFLNPIGGRIADLVALAGLPIGFPMVFYVVGKQRLKLLPYPQPVARLSVWAANIVCFVAYWVAQGWVGKAPYSIRANECGVAARTWLWLHNPPRLRLPAFEDGAHHRRREKYWSVFHCAVPSCEFVTLRKGWAAYRELAVTVGALAGACPLRRLYSLLTCRLSFMMKGQYNRNG